MTRQRRHKKKITPPRCGECGSESQKTRGSVIYPGRHDLHDRVFWRCRNHECRAYCGSHRDGTPLGFPVGPQTRGARRNAHAAFDVLWKVGGLTRTEAYKWLSEKLGIPGKECHIGMMSYDLCQRVVEVCIERRREMWALAGRSELVAPDEL